MKKKTAQRIKDFCMSSSMYLKFINGMANRFFYCENQSELQRGFKGETLSLILYYTEMDVRVTRTIYSVM